MMRLFLKSLLLVFLIAVVLWGLLILDIYRTSLESKNDQNEKVDAIVVLGASQWKGVPSPMLKARLDHAHELYGEGIAEYIILTGGKSEGNTISEAGAGKIYLYNKGVPEDKILTEGESRTTKESLRNVAEILEDNDINEVLFVSHGYHLYRVKKIAERNNIKKSGTSAVKLKDKPLKFKYILRESLIVPLIYFVN